MDLVVELKSAARVLLLATTLTLLLLTARISPVAAESSLPTPERLKQLQESMQKGDVLFLQQQLTDKDSEAYYTTLRAELTQPLTAWKLLPVDAAHLRLLRNEIFARHGYTFKSADLNKYFQQFDWYKPGRSLKEIKLSKVERGNVELLQRLEKLKNRQVEGYANLLAGERSHRCEDFKGENEDIIVTEQSLTFKQGMKYRPLENRQVPHAGSYAVTGLEKVCRIADLPYVFVLDLDYEFLVTGSYYANGVVAYDLAGNEVLNMSGGGTEFRYLPDSKLYLSTEDQGSGGGTDVHVTLADAAGKVLKAEQGYIGLAAFIPAGGSEQLVWLFGGYQESSHATDHLLVAGADSRLVVDTPLPLLASVPMPYWDLHDHGIDYAGLVDAQTIYVQFSDKSEGLILLQGSRLGVQAAEVVELPRLFIGSESHQYKGLEWPLTPNSDVDYFGLQNVVDSPFDVVYVDQGRKLFVSEHPGDVIYLFSPDKLAGGVPEASLRIGESKKGARLAYDGERDLLFVAPVEANEVKVYSAAARDDDPPLFSFKTRACKMQNLYWDGDGDRLYLACGKSTPGLLSYQLDLATKSAVEKSAFTPYVVLAGADGTYTHALNPNDLFINREHNEAYIIGGGYDGLLTVPADIFIDYPEEGLYYTGGKDLFFKEELLGRGCNKKSWNKPSFSGDPVRLIFGRAQNKIGNRVDLFEPEHLLFDPLDDLFYVFGHYGSVQVYDRMTDARMSGWKACRHTYRRVKTARRIEPYTATGVGYNLKAGELVTTNNWKSIRINRFREGEEKFVELARYTSKKPYRQPSGRSRHLAVDAKGRRLFAADGKAGSIEIYAEDDGGRMVRKGAIAGEQTRLGRNPLLAVDPTRKLLYAFGKNDKMLGFSLEANGDVAPQKILPSLSDLAEGMAVSAETGEVFVAPGHFGGMVVASPGEQGKWENHRMIEGQISQINSPVAVAVDDLHKEVFVANGNGTILCFDRDADGSVAPKRRIVSEVPLRDIALDLANDKLYALSREKDLLLVFARKADGSAFPEQKIDLTDRNYGNGLLSGVQVPSSLVLLP